MPPRCGAADFASIDRERRAEVVQGGFESSPS